ALCRLAQLWLEAADAQPRHGTLHPIDQPCLFPDQQLALAAGAPGILLLQRWDRRHRAMIPLAAQPAQKHPLQQLDVQPIRLRPLVLLRCRDARRVDGVGLPPSLAQPARQPEPVAPDLVGQNHPADRPADPLRLLPPTLQKLQQRLRIRRQLLHRSTGNARDETADKPARRAHLDHRYHRAILLEDDEGTAQILNASHGAPSSVLHNDDGATPSSFPIASVEAWAAWATTGGPVIGLDHRLGHAVKLGLAFSYGHTDVDPSASSPASTSVDSYQ